MIVDNKDVSGDHKDEADFVVIGTGAAGGAAAKVLAEAGHEVVIIEEGRYVGTSEFKDTVYDATLNMFRDTGTLTAMGKAITLILQGRCVGGSTAINAAICWRIPEDVYEQWTGKWGLSGAIPRAELDDCFETIEDELNIHPVEKGVMGLNNDLMAKGAAALGIPGRIIPRNEKGCTGTGRCLTGCPNDAKLSTNVAYIPRALDQGARLYTSCRAERIQILDGRAKVVHAAFKDPYSGKGTHTLKVHARKAIVVAASALQTPNLLRQSGIGLKSGHLGEHFQAHPGASMAGLFPHEVRMWEGATQGWDTDHYRISDHIKFEAISLQPELAAVRIPGVGAEFMKGLADYSKMAVWACAIHSQAEGRVRPAGNHPKVKFNVTEADMKGCAKGLGILGRMMFAAGADAVFPGVHGMPHKISREHQHQLDNFPLDPRCYTMLMTHMFGTTRMGTDPKKSVVGPDFQVHGTPGVYVVDSSVFPTNLGVNPQHTIMAMATLASRRIAAL